MKSHYCGYNNLPVGVDRLDSAKGYTHDNCVSCCSCCNRMKLKQSKTEFISRCKRIVEKIKTNF